MRKIITVPKNKDALKALDYDNATNDQLYELSLNDLQFEVLWNTGIFNSINAIANVNIDNWEDERIIGKAVLEKIISSGVFDMHFDDVELNKIIKEVKELFLKAIKCETGVFFFF